MRTMDSAHERPVIKLESTEKIRKELFQKEKEFENTLTNSKLAEAQNDKVLDYIKESEASVTDNLTIDRQESM